MCEIQVVNRSMPWKGGLVAINCFGFGGANVHLLLCSNSKPKIFLQPEISLPIIVGVSGRTESAVHKFLDKINENKKDDELLGLVHNIHSNNINGHGYRGFLLHDDKKIVRDVCEVSSEKRPIW